MSKKIDKVSRAILDSFRDAVRFEVKIFLEHEKLSEYEKQYIDRINGQLSLVTRIAADDNRVPGETFCDFLAEANSIRDEAIGKIRLAVIEEMKNA